MKTRSPSTREPFLAAPTSIGIVLQRRYKRPHVIDPAARSTGCSPSTVTMADRAPAQRNTAVAQRLEGTSRTLINDDIPAGVRNKPRSPPHRRRPDGRREDHRPRQERCRRYYFAEVEDCDDR